MLLNILLLFYYLFFFGLRFTHSQGTAVWSISVKGFFPLKNLVNLLLKDGMRVLPPTSTTASISATFTFEVSSRRSRLKIARSNTLSQCFSNSFLCTVYADRPHLAPTLSRLDSFIFVSSATERKTCEGPFESFGKQFVCRKSNKLEY